MIEAEAKPRSDSKLKLLPEDQQERIWGWLNTPSTTLEDVAVLCHDDLNVRTSRTALGEFRKWYGLKLRLADRENRVAQLLEELQRSGSLHVDQVQHAGAAIFMSEALALGDGEGFESAARVHLKAKELQAKIEGSKLVFEQKEKALALEREKFEHGKLELKRQIEDLRKNISSPDAPARLARLVELIDSL